MPRAAQERLVERRSVGGEDCRAASAPTVEPARRFAGVAPDGEPLCRTRRNASKFWSARFESSAGAQGSGSGALGSVDVPAQQGRFQGGLRMDRAVERKGARGRCN